ncbi:hypothetical protein AB0I87_13615 [Streptomyces sp. NPDC049952]|uniref:hypothetical protein n=1 Tax=Streptomyces sp. NPDC049952 TaxID=3156665 RepID=UPI00341B1888
MDESLSFESLLEGAKKAGHKAMDDHGRGEYDEFALHGGVAVERLAKAVLVSKNPVYLLEMRNGNSDMLLYLGGHFEMSPNKVRTVGAKDAIKRLRTLGLLSPDEQLDLLIELRNGTAHTTIDDQAKALLPTLADNVAALLKSIGLGNNDFWGRWASAMHIAVDKQRNEVERDVELRIRQARHRLNDRFAGLPEGTQMRALAEPSTALRSFNISHFPQPADDDRWYVLATVGCPACAGEAVLQLFPEAGADFQLVGEAPTDRHLLPNALSCPLCHLQLGRPAEVKAAGLQNPLEAELPTQTVTVTGFLKATPFRGGADAEGS